MANGLLPVHFKPKEDELLSSWLARLAVAHGLAPSAFCSLRLSTHLHDDIDLIEDIEILNLLAEGVGISISRVVASTLPSYKDWLYEGDEATSHPWIMPVDFNPRNRTFGLQFCPQCLSDDEEPYFRRRWRLALATLCEKHLIPLLDSCSHCGSCISSLIRRTTVRQQHIALCPSCDMDLRTTTSSPALFETDPEVQFQKHLMEVLRQGWVEIIGSGPVYSHLYFKVLYGFMTLLSSNRFSRSTLGALCQHYNVSQFSLSLPEREPSMEQLRVEDRRAILEMIRRLFVGWPTSFIDFWARRKPENYNFIVSEFSKHGNHSEIPFWLWVVLHDSVIGPSYLGWDEIYAVSRECQQGEKSWFHKYLAVLHSSADKGSIGELTDEQWAIVAPLISEQPCRSGHRGRPYRTYRDVLNGILCKFRRDVPWHYIPEQLPAVQTCHSRFQQWLRDGTLRRILEALARDLEERGGVNLSEGFVDDTFFFANKKDALRVSQSMREGGSPWIWQTFLLFISPATRKLLRRVKSPLAKIIFSKV